MGQNKITPRTEVNTNLKNMIGKVLITNLFSTFRGELLYIQNGRCYFKLLENKIYPKYNCSAGQVEFLPEKLVVTLNFENE
jgi:hypothetical protein